MQPWTPEPLFAGKTVAVLGNGPSLADTDLSQIDPDTTIAVNASAEKMPDAAVLFARDLTWCLANRRLIEAWAGLAVTTNRRAALTLGMRYVDMDRRDDFPPRGTPVIRYGVSSGHAAVALVIAMGAVQILLYGFDGRSVAGRTHWHDHYETDPHIYASRFVPAWRGWAAAAAAVGCRILNATPGSAITEFPFAETQARAA